MTDQVTSTVATLSVTAAIASSGITLLVRYLRVSRSWYTSLPPSVVGRASRGRSRVSLAAPCGTHGIRAWLPGWSGRLGACP